MTREKINNILQILERFPQGVSLEKILQEVGTALSKRTVQRYLKILAQEGRLSVMGKARARRYRLSVVPSEKGASVIPLSTMALSIDAQVHQPLQKRRPVGYQREFLERYRPNETFYLSEKVRKHLAELGKSPEGERPAGTYARQILDRLLIDLSWNSSRLEGNTYSLLETERLLELKVGAEGKNLMETQMILNHKAAIEFLVASAEMAQFNAATILNLHALLSDNLLHDPRACGSLRTHPVSIGKSVYQPLAIPQLIHEYFEHILTTAHAIMDPFEQSFFVMVQLPYLQPFIDVNRRVSRLAANIPLIRNNLCPLSFVDVPESLYISGLLGIYELNQIELLREVFIWAYERSSALYSATRQELGEPDPFRLHHRNLIITTVSEIVRECLNKPQAVAAIKHKASTLPLPIQAKFLEIIETELMSLHSGNIARFRLTSAEYDQWSKTWK